MKKFQLVRDKSTDQGTFSVMMFENRTMYATELPWRNNEKERSCIPAGTYECLIINSPKHGRVYEVQGVAGRSNIEIHIANFGGDVDMGYTSELEGCIAPAMSIGYLSNHSDQSQRCGLSSSAAFQLFMIWANGDPLELTISETP